MKQPSSIEPKHNGKTLNHWLRLLDVNASEEGNKVAQDAIRIMGKAVLPILVRDIQRGGRHAQRAAGAFQVLGAEAASAIPELAQNPGPEPTFAAYALVGVGRAAAETLISFLSHPDSTVRSAGAEGIGGLASPLRKALSPTQQSACTDILLRNLHDPVFHVRARSASALGMLACEPARCVPALVELLASKDSLTLTSTAQALERFGGAALPALPQLLALSQSKDGPLRSCVIATLANIPAQQAYEAVLKARSDTNSDVRCAAIHGLGKYPDRVPEILPILIQTLQIGTQTEKSNVLRALALLGPVASEALPMVRSLLETNEAGGEANIRFTIRCLEQHK